jgi:insulysin
MELSSYLNTNLTSTNEIIKSKYDSRDYSTKKLDNGMRIIWIHDTNAVKSAASMVVGVGHFSDGKVKGMAHLLEHMLFMGSSEYKDVDYYSKKISEFGGMSNAYTAHNHTNYFFDVANVHLFEALKIFSRFFIDPSLDKSCIEKEKNAVDSEHNKNKLSDVWRYQEMTHMLGKHKTPFSNFSTGNLDTFNVVDLHRQLKDFYKKYYSSDIMTLVVVSDKSFDDTMTEQKTWSEHISELFNEVPNTNILPRINKEYDYDKILEHNNQYIEMVPVKDEDIIKLIWEVPYKYQQQNTYNFISHVLGHEGENTLIYILRKNLWINNFSVFCHEPVGKNMFFEIKIKIAPKGKKHITEIIDMTMKYINMIKTSGINKDLYDEYAKTAINDFVRQDKPDGIDYVSILSATANNILNVQNEQIMNVLTSDVIFSDFTYELQQNLINMLHIMDPQRVNIMVSSYVFKNLTKNKEEYYGIEYTKTIENFHSMKNKMHMIFSDDKKKRK